MAQSRILTPDAARKRCYEGLLAEVRATVDRYYQEYPERRAEPRAEEDQQWMMRLSQRIIRMLDSYQITEAQTA